MFHSSVVAFPWDLMDEGLDTALDVLQGEIGVTCVSVWAATPPQLQLRARPVEPRCFRTEGGVFFQPDRTLYGDSRCQPATADWIKSRNPFARIVEGCEKRALAVRANVSLTKIGRLAEQYPAVACKNVFGLASQCSICLLNPDVQALLAALVRDLTSNYALTAIVLADLKVGWGDAGDMQVPARGDEAKALRRLLCLCFCESCRQRASASGLELSQVQRSVEDMIDAGMNGKGDTHSLFGDAAAEEPVLADLFRWQAAERLDFVKRLIGVSQCDVYILQDESESGEDDPASTIDVEGVGLITSIERIETLTECSPHAQRPHELRIPLAATGHDDGTVLVQALATAVEKGYAGVELDHYGAISPSRMAYVKQAIRFVRRTGIA